MRPFYGILAAQTEDTGSFSLVHHPQFPGGHSKRDTILVNQIKGFLIDVRQELRHTTSNSFYGSIELEVFSSRDMVVPLSGVRSRVFTFRAACLFIRLNGFITILRTCNKTTGSKFQKRDFISLPNEKSVGYFSFVNGAISSPITLFELEGINSEGERKVFKGIWEIFALMKHEQFFFMSWIRAFWETNLAWLKSATV